MYNRGMETTSLDMNEEMIITVKDIMLLITGLQQINEQVGKAVDFIPDEVAKELVACEMTEMHILLKLLPRKVGEPYIKQMQELFKQK